MVGAQGVSHVVQDFVTPTFGPLGHLSLPVLFVRDVEHMPSGNPEFAVNNETFNSSFVAFLVFDIVASLPSDPETANAQRVLAAQLVDNPEYREERQNSKTRIAIKPSNNGLLLVRE